MQLRLSGIFKCYNANIKNNRDYVLNDLDLCVPKKSIIAITGNSGSGKSTLLHIAGLLDKPDKGTIEIDDQRIEYTSDICATKMRKEHIAFAYQFHHLLPEFSVIENLLIPQYISGISKVESKYRAEQLLREVGMEKFAQSNVNTLSGGEQQRISVCRALITNAKLILADEPTGNLDKVNSEILFSMLLNIIRNSNKSIIIVTHNIELAQRCDKIFVLNDGKLRERFF